MSQLVGRARERAALQEAMERASSGSGALLLVAGEAGVGKTALVDHLSTNWGALVLRGTSTQDATAPYGPIVSAFRAHLRADPDALEGSVPLLDHLAVLLPELGPAAASTNRMTLFEAVRIALAQLASKQPVLLTLEDLHWSDAATLDLLGGIAESLGDLPALVVGTYRSDGLPRDHGLRRLRNELRRAGRLHELVLEPLSRDELGELLGELLNAPPSPSLVRAVHDRTAGLPFFAEELAGALVAAGAIQPGRDGLLELAGDDDLPLPDTVRDAVRLAAHEMSEDARAAADAAAVAGERFDVELVAGVAGDGGIDELLAHPLIVDTGDGSARFRHALSREAVYADIPWLRRRRLHRSVGEALELRGAPATETAIHWVGARDGEKARAALVAAAAESEAVHAYSDAAQYGRQALELWSEGADDDPARIEALERYARCSELAGDLLEAVRGWRELCDIHGSRGEGLLLANCQRRLARAYDLKGERDSAFAARRIGAEAFAANGMPAEAAVEHLAMANHLRLTGKLVAAVELARTAVADADLAGRLDLRLRGLGLEGLARAKTEDYEAGLAITREALAQALEHDMTRVAAELYQRLSIVLYESANYNQAAEALNTALDLCRIDGGEYLEEACVSCFAYVLRDLGEWQEAARICRELEDGQSLFVAEGLLGSIRAYQGRFTAARRMLNASLAQSSRLRHYNMTIDSTTALAFVAAAEGAHDEAVDHCRAILKRWEASDDNHYALSGLRWAAAYLARTGELDDAHACTDALTKIASASGQPEALAALAHAIAELALVDGDADAAAEQLLNALELHRGIDMPFVRTQIELRAGVALAAAGDVEAGLERLAAAYRTARKLGARPVAAEAAREAAALGDSVVRRLGRGAEADAEDGGLSRREREVLRMLAVGRTNREIAQELFLSPRTVDMHVRNILRKLDVRSRVEAANRAGELGLVS